MEIKQLKLFLQVYKDKSFSKASKNCDISQQGLSQAISLLESEIGVPLFNRTARGLQLTEYGEYLKQNCECIVESAEVLNNRIIDMAPTSDNIIKIGFASGVINALLAADNPLINEIYSNKCFTITESPDLMCEQKLKDGITDIAFSIGPINENEFHSYKIQTNQMCVLVSKENPLSENVSINIQDFRNHPLISVNENFKTYYNLINMCLKSGFNPDLKHMISEITTMHLLAKKNLGLGITVDFIAKQVFDPKVKVIPINKSLFPWDVYMIIRRNHKNRPEVRSLWNRIISENVFSVL